MPYRESNVTLLIGKHANMIFFKIKYFKKRPIKKITWLAKGSHLLS
jgi:hypothetical protein